MPILRGHKNHADVIEECGWLTARRVRHNQGKMASESMVRRCSDSSEWLCTEKSSPMLVLQLALSVTHVLVAAAWFGAMFYSLTVLHPRAALFFKKNEDFEALITTMSAGARWKVLGACLLLAASGIWLTLINWRSPVPSIWLVFIGLKLALFLVALALFSYTSWWLWPARVFATAEELPLFQRKFRWIAWSLTVLVGLNIALGVAAHIR